MDVLLVVVLLVVVGTVKLPAAFVVFLVPWMSFLLLLFFLLLGQS